MGLRGLSTSIDVQSYGHIWPSLDGIIRGMTVGVTIPRLPPSSSFEARLYGHGNRTTGARIAVKMDAVFSPTGIVNKAPRPLLNDSDNGNDDSDQVLITKGVSELRINVLVFILCGLADALASVWSSLNVI